MGTLEKLRLKMSQVPVDAFLVSNMQNWRFVSGFTGDAGTLLITRDEAIIFTDSRYTEQAEQEAPDYTVIKTVVEKNVLKETIDKIRISRIAFEKDYVTYSRWEKLKETLSGQELIGVSGWVEELRAVKSEEEAGYIARAQGIADEAFSRLLPLVKAGASEMDLALELEFTIRKLGSEGIAFPFIVVSGARSSLPHGVPTSKKLEPGDFVTFDFGARCNGYCSDMTRTVVVGHASDKHREIYDLVLRAQLAALEVIKPGVMAREVDLAGRRVIEEAGYGEYFGHGIGHGVGLNVHEKPSVGKTQKTCLSQEW